LQILRLAKTYIEIKGMSEKENEARSNEIQRASISLQMPLVSSPPSKDARSLQMQFISSWEDLEKELRLVFSFVEDGRLGGIEMNLTGESKVFGSVSIPGPGSRIEVIVPAETWIDGLELNICNADDLSADAKVGVSGIKVIICSHCQPLLVYEF